MARDGYVEQVQLLVRVLPVVAEETRFALKGGTAINLFYRDLPRLSVDIDLTYLPIQDRAESLAGIDGLRFADPTCAGCRRKSGFAAQQACCESVRGMENSFQQLGGVMNAV